MLELSYKPRPGTEDEIYEAIGDITLSTKTRDHLQLSGLTITTTPESLNTKERAAYEQIRYHLVVELGDQVVDAANTASLSGKLLQLASGRGCLTFCV